MKAASLTGAGVISHETGVAIVAVEENDLLQEERKNADVKPGRLIAFEDERPKPIDGSCKFLMRGHALLRKKCVNNAVDISARRINFFWLSLNFEERKIRNFPRPQRRFTY